MTSFGAVPTQIRAGIIVDGDYDEMTGTVSTINGSLEDITGATFDIDVPTGVTARVLAVMTFQTSTTGGSPAIGSWAISINSVDGTELQRYLSGINDTGIGAVLARSAVLTAGTYTVVGRHRRVSGASTINTDTAQLSAFVVLE